MQTNASKHSTISTPIDRFEDDNGGLKSAVSDDTYADRKAYLRFYQTPERVARCFTAFSD